MLACSSMAWIIVGLGNPGEEYKRSRHNTGRMALEYFARTHDFSDWNEDRKNKATVSRGNLQRKLVALVAPDTFMNKSGAAVSKYVKNVKAAEHLIVVYDDLDLPLGAIKVSFDRGSGGHKGLESVVRAVKTKKFARVRIGVSPSTGAGKLRKPAGEKEVVDFILEKFRAHEMDQLKEIFKRAGLALEAIILEGVSVAMNRSN
jgi:PTH1 family peptidyl-tRNA hydrolase